MIAVIDNYDSFTYNLVQYMRQLGADVNVWRNDEVEIATLQHLPLSHILISPGPGTPQNAGISNDVIRTFHGRIPILGVCLGHQCLAHVFGGHVAQAGRLMHGKVSTVYHDGDELFHGIPSPFRATRYHSLIVYDPLPAAFVRTAYTVDGEIMAMRHHHHPTFGVQFHPESILTQGGHRLLQNFLHASCERTFATA